MQRILRNHRHLLLQHFRTIPRLHCDCSRPPQRQARKFSVSSLSESREWIVVRHGETEWNLAKKVQGRTDIELNPTGQKQANYTAKALVENLLGINSKNDDGNRDRQGFKVRIYSSPLLRAHDTAKAIAKEFASSLPPSSISLTTTAALKEWDLGCLEGLARNQTVRDCPEDWKIFREWSNPWVSSEVASIPIRGGESMEQVRCRAVQFFEEESLSSTKSVYSEEAHDILIAVTHGGVLGQLLRHVASAQYHDRGEGAIQDENSKPDKERHQTNYHKPQNACITRMAVDPASSLWSIKSWASVAHLSGTSVEPIDTNYHSDRKE